MKLLWDFLKGRIHIDVRYVIDGVQSIKEPKVINKVITKSTQSNYRFCQYETKNPGEKETRVYYYTESFVNGKWNKVDDTWFHNKDKALEAHVALVKGEGLSDLNVSKNITTVLWEGLTKEETEVWINLQKGVST